MLKILKCTLLQHYDKKVSIEKQKAPLGPVSEFCRLLRVLIVAAVFFKW